MFHADIFQISATSNFPPVHPARWQVQNAKDTIRRQVKLFPEGMSPVFFPFISRIHSRPRTTLTNQLTLQSRKVS